MALHAELAVIMRASSSGVERSRSLRRCSGAAMTPRACSPRGTGVELPTEDVVRDRLAVATQQRRQLVRGRIEEASGVRGTGRDPATRSPRSCRADRWRGSTRPTRRFSLQDPPRDRHDARGNCCRVSRRRDDPVDHGPSAATGDGRRRPANAEQRRRGSARRSGSMVRGDRWVARWSARSRSGLSRALVRGSRGMLASLLLAGVGAGWRGRVRYMIRASTETFTGLPRRQRCRSTRRARCCRGTRICSSGSNR